MSKYKRIETEITSLHILRQAMQEVVTRENLKFEEGDKIARAYRRGQDTRVHFVIRKEMLRAYGDLGFVRSPVDNTFQIIVDDLDRRGQKVAREVRRSYAVLDAAAKAQARGYTVSPVKDEQGRVLELRLRRY